jgi:hypothetical protein
LSELPILKALSITFNIREAFNGSRGVFGNEPKTNSYSSEIKC